MVISRKDQDEESKFVAGNAQKALLASFAEKAANAKEEYAKLQEYCNYLKTQYEELLNSQDDQNEKEKVALSGALLESKKEVALEKSRGKSQVNFHCVCAYTLISIYTVNVMILFVLCVLVTCRCSNSVRRSFKCRVR